MPAHGVVITDHARFPTLATMKSEIGYSMTFQIIAALLTNFLSSLNVVQPTEMQIFEITKELISDYPTYKPEDFKIFFTNCKKGKYGEFYNRIDMQTIYKMLSQFDAERTELFESELENKKNILNSNPSIRIENMEDVGSVMAKVYGREKEKANEERQREKLIEEKREEWTAQAVKEWEFNRTLYVADNISENPIPGDVKDLEIKYAQYYPKGDYIRWYIKKKIDNL